ncbi:MAG: hypothetical protein HC806_03120 [Anaerolineae bacterium]|nr:hypothetical protein [Anaerolineae bacterium]
MEETILVRNLANRISVGAEIPYDFISDIIQRANITPEMSMEEIESALVPFGEDLVTWTYKTVVNLSREREILPVWIFLPTFEGTMSEETKNKLINTASDAGFFTIDLSDIYTGQDIRQITVAEWDLHPNRNGHMLIAENLYKALLENPNISRVMGIKK